MKIGDLQVKPSVSGAEKLPCAYADGEETWALTPNQLKAFVGVGGGVGGAAGPGGSVVFDQMSASAAWVIAHYLNCFPSVTVVDSSGSTVEGDVKYVDGNSLTIHFAAAFAGVAYLN